MFNDALYKKTGARVELLTDVDMYNFFEKGIRGGLSVQINRFSQANHKHLKLHNPKERTKFILYADANNLYGWAMKQRLPYRHFEWEEVDQKGTNYWVRCIKNMDKAAPRPEPAPRMYLEVAFAEKDTVKTLGARWDPDVKKWYVPDGVNSEPFEQWLLPVMPRGELRESDGANFKAFWLKRQNELFREKHADTCFPDDWGTKTTKVGTGEYDEEGDEIVEEIAGKKSPVAGMSFAEAEQTTKYIESVSYTHLTLPTILLV